MFGILIFLLLALDFGSYFIKLIGILCRVSLYLGVRLVLHLALNPKETFVPWVHLASFKPMLGVRFSRWIFK